MSDTTIRVQVATRDALARIAAEHDETMDQALVRLVREHDAGHDVDAIDRWYASMPAAEQAITDALAEADRAAERAA